MPLGAVLRYADPMRGINWMLGRGGSSADRSGAAAGGGAARKAAPVLLGIGYDAQQHLQVDEGFRAAVVVGDPLGAAAAVGRIAAAERDAAAVLVTGVDNMLQSVYQALERQGAVQCALLLCRRDAVPAKARGAVGQLRRRRLLRSVCTNYDLSTPALRATLADVLEGCTDRVEVTVGGASSAEASEMRAQSEAKLLSGRLRRFPETLDALRTIAENLAFRPGEPKYRSLFAGSDRFAHVIGRHADALAVLRLLGFSTERDAEGCYCADEPDSAMVHEVLCALQRELDRAGRRGSDELEPDGGRRSPPAAPAPPASRAAVSPGSPGVEEAGAAVASPAGSSARLLAGAQQSPPNPLARGAAEGVGQESAAHPEQDV
eukprot:TRINITY_DN8783_c0_g2_i1.p1 TRINITY_DN8783_c0_g2~~TRINITY_DN8783_c0_g2_i1.p1  ORF type:complete len:376 (+),score=114.11 TRINITY_DN8783_c0_g2_i1:78-1205(+)